MPTISLTDPVAHTNADAGVIATNNGNLRTLLNSGLDGVNLKGNPSLSSGDVPIWDAGSSSFKRNLIVTVLLTNVVSGTTDIAWGSSPSDYSPLTYLRISTGGGTLRRIGAPLLSGQRVVVFNNTSSSVTITHNAGAGTGAVLLIRGGANISLLQNESIEFVYDGTSWIEIGRDSASSGAEVAYNEITANATSTATSAATATTLIAGTAITYDGTPVIVEVFSPGITCSLTTSQAILELYDGATDLGQLWRETPAVNNTVGNGVFARRKLTPTAGSHTFTLKGWVSAAATLTLVAGAGGAATDLPAFIRVVKV